LARFARNEWSDVVWGHELDGLHDELRDEGRSLSRLTNTLARDVIRLLGTHRERILDMELIHQRVTAAAVELYAMAAVIAKLQGMLDARDAAGGNGNGHGSSQFDRDLIVGKSYCRHAADRIGASLRSLFDNQDAEMLRTADAVLGCTG
jgi:hypothetical protein